MTGEKRSGSDICTRPGAASICRSTQTEKSADRACRARTVWLRYSRWTQALLPLKELQAPDFSAWTEVENCMDRTLTRRRTALFWNASCQMATASTSPTNMEPS